MRQLNYFFIAISFLLHSAGLLAQVSIGGYNVYYGSLHNHSNVSDGTGTPAEAYNYAKDTSHLDFFSLADHSGSIDATEWTAIKNAANAYNQDGVFAAFWGFEWSSSGAYGHIAVINTDDYCTTASPVNTFSALCTWLNSRECVAFMNHPGRENGGRTEFNHFTTTPSDKIAGMELWNKNVGFSTYYYNDGYYTSDGNKGYFDEAITRNWKIGASGSEDNHSGNWGNASNYRMAVLANAKTRTDIYAAIQARRFFSTLDKNIALSFKINGSEMGSTVMPGNYTMQILATDGDGEVFTSVKLVKNGVVVNTWTPNSANPNITQTLTCNTADYFYVIIKEADNDEAISSPVWCSGSNQPPSVAITGPADNSWYNAPALVSINATAADNDGTVAKVEFYQGNVKIGEDLSSPYSFNWTNVPAGTYVLTAKATDNLGAQTTSSPVYIYVIPQYDVMTTSVIAGGSDDVEENAAGVMYINSTDIELVYDSYNANGNQIVGLRFLNLEIPASANIKNAYIQFTVDEATTGTCTVMIKGEASDNSAAFTSANFNVSGRPQTTVEVSWSPVSWTIAGEAGINQSTPDLKDIIQEIVNRPGYTSASAVSMIITGTGTRTAEAYEGSASQAARFYVTYSTAPVADFIADQTNVEEGSVIHFTDLSTHGPASWNWSFPGGTPSTSTEQNPSITYDTPGDYSVTLTVLNSGGSNTLERNNYIHVIPTDYCASQSENYSAEYIGKFTLGSFVKTSSGSTYSDYTNPAITIQANTKYTVKITPTFTGNKKQEYFKVWIDYNNDLDFDDAGENVVTGMKNIELKTTFTTPANITGTKRLRVAMKRLSYSGPCETFTYGEVEDYTVSFGNKSCEVAAGDIIINNNTDPGLKIYPNPATKNLYCEKMAERTYELEIYSIAGQLVWKSMIEDTLTMIDISKLEPGLYLIKYVDHEGIKIKKLVVY